MTELILDRLEPTVSLALFTILLAVLIAVPLGVLAAYRHGGWLDRIVMGFSVLGFSVPVFVIGYVLIYIFAIELNWLPVLPCHESLSPNCDGIAVTQRHFFSAVSSIDTTTSALNG